jgi:hypothetical protein
LFDDVLDESLVDAGAPRRKAARPVSLPDVRYGGPQASSVDGVHNG